MSESAEGERKRLLDAYIEKTVAEAPWLGDENPFGKWTTYRATIAALSRSDAHDVEAEAEARSMLRAARLADTIMKVRADLTENQKAILRGLLK